MSGAVHVRWLQKSDCAGFGGAATVAFDTPRGRGSAGQPWNGVVNAPDALRRSTCLQKTAVLQGAFRRLTLQMSQVIGSEGEISAAYPSLDSGKTLRATTGDPLDFRATSIAFS
jgi:hypothetical protein